MDDPAYRKAEAEIYGALLDAPADLDAIKASQAEFAKDDFTHYSGLSMDELLDNLLAWFGGDGLSQDAKDKIHELLMELEGSL